MTSKKRAPLESFVENKSCEHAENQGYDHIKLDRAKRKWPDRLFLGPYGQKILVEFKREGEKPRPQQDAFHKKLRGNHHEIHIIDTVVEFIQLLDRYRV